MGLTARCDHPIAGRFDQVGLSYQLSETPAKIAGGPLVLGEDTAGILSDLGYSQVEIAALAADKVAGLWSPGEPLIEGRRVMGAGKAAKESAKAN